jgi:hypothetical protein
MFFRSHSANWLTDLVNTVWLVADVMIHQQLYELPRGAAVAGRRATRLRLRLYDSRVGPPDGGFFLGPD